MEQTETKKVKKTRNFFETDVVYRLGDVVETSSTTDLRGKVVKTAILTKPIGIKRLSMVDFLHNHCGYHLGFDFRKGKRA